MEDDRIPKQVYFGQLSSGKRPQYDPVRPYKDNSQDQHEEMRSATEVTQHSSIWSSTVTPVGHRVI